MEQRQPASVLGHQDERRGAHGVRRSLGPRANPLANTVLPAPRSPTRHHQVARRRHGRQAGGKVSGLRGVSASSRRAGAAWRSGHWHPEGSRSRRPPPFPGDRGSPGPRWPGVRRSARGRRAARRARARPRAAIRAASRGDGPGEPPRPHQRPPRAPPARRPDAAAHPQPSRAAAARRRAVLVEHQRRRVDQAARPATPASRSRMAATGVAIDRRTVPSRASTPNGALGVQRGPLAALRGLEVAQLLAGQRGDHDAADAHRAGAGERLRVDARPDDEDAAGPPDVDAARPELPERIGRELEAARAGEPAAMTPRRPGRPPGFGSRRPARPPDLAGQGRRDLDAVIAGHDPPAVPRPGQRARARRPASLGRCGVRAAGDPAGPADRRSASGAVADVTTCRPPVAQVLQDRTSPAVDDDPPATIARSPGGSGNRASRPRPDGAGRGRERRAQDVAVASRVHPRPQGRLPRGEEVPPSLGPVGQPERDVAQVHDQPAQPARDLDGRVPYAHPEVDGSRNRSSTVARSPGGRSTSSSPPGARSTLGGAALAADGRGAPSARPARSPAGMHDAAQAEAAGRRGGRPRPRAAPPVLDGAERCEQPGVVPAEGAGRRAAAGHRRARGPLPGPGATAQAPPVAMTTPPAGALVHARGRGPQAARAPHVPRPCRRRAPFSGRVAPGHEGHLPQAVAQGEAGPAGSSASPPPRRGVLP